MPVYQLLYFSTAADPITPATLKNILDSSRKNNAQLEISGLLVHSTRHFLQVIEGSQSDVQALFEVIAKDPRHRDVVVIYQNEVDGRGFAGWAMAHFDFREGDEELRDSFTQICQPDPQATAGYPDLDSARRFVNAFRNVLDARGS